MNMRSQDGKRMYGRRPQTASAVSARSCRASACDFGAEIPRPRLLRLVHSAANARVLLIIHNDILCFRRLLMRRPHCGYKRHALVEIVTALCQTRPLAVAEAYTDPSRLHIRLTLVELKTKTNTGRYLQHPSHLSRGES